MPLQQYAYMSGLLGLLMCTDVLASNFKMMKPGEWKIEIIDSSMGPYAKHMPANNFCVDQDTDRKGWEAKMKAEMRKASMDCNVSQFKEETNQLSYKITCKPIEGGQGNNPLMGPGTSMEGDMTMRRISDTEYLMEQQSKMKGMKMPEMDLSKVPAEQRKLIEQTIQQQAGGVQFNTKQRYTFVQEKCSQQN